MISHFRLVVMKLFNFWRLKKDELSVKPFNTSKNYVLIMVLLQAKTLRRYFKIGGTQDQVNQPKRIGTKRDDNYTIGTNTFPFDY